MSFRCLLYTNDRFDTVQPAASVTNGEYRSSKSKRKGSPSSMYAMCEKISDYRNIKGLDQGVTQIEIKSLELHLGLHAVSQGIFPKKVN